MTDGVDRGLKAPVAGTGEKAGDRRVPRAMKGVTGEERTAIEGDLEALLSAITVMDVGILLEIVESLKEILGMAVVETGEGQGLGVRVVGEIGEGLGVIVQEEVAVGVVVVGVAKVETMELREVGVVRVGVRVSEVAEVVEALRQGPLVCPGVGVKGIRGRLERLVIIPGIKDV